MIDCRKKTFIWPLKLHQADWYVFNGSLIVTKKRRKGMNIVFMMRRVAMPRDRFRSSHIFSLLGLRFLGIPSLLIRILGWEGEIKTDLVFFSTGVIQRKSWGRIEFIPANIIHVCSLQNQGCRKVLAMRLKIVTL